MARLVTKFKYYKPHHSKNFGGYAKYIALRNGAESLPDSKKGLPSTLGQKQLIEKLLKDFPDCAEMLEYDDYIKSPTAENASEFLHRAIEDNFQAATAVSTYADYIATRPRAEKLGRHGLFSNDGEEIVLSQVSAELNRHEGNMWTMIVSLRREDAERLSFDNAASWRELLRAHTSELADALKIPLSELKWYAAFHNESHHPHIHLLAYCDDPSVGYLTKQGINNMRSALGNDIFRDELQFVFREQTDRRDLLKKDWKAMLDEILQKISENKYSNPEAEQKLLLLSDKLSRTKGKKVYGYLKRDVKDLIDSIVDLLAEDENISRLYDLWYEKKYEILRTYTSEMPPKIPLSQNKEFKSIKNDIIREAMKLHEDSGQTETNPPKKQSQTQAPQKISPTVSATAVTRLFKNLCGIFRDRIDDRRQNSQPTVDKRQKKEIEEKKNAEMSML